jgi:hypothetical protein
VAELIKKGTAILQLCSTKPCEHKSAYNNTMATCDMPPLTSYGPFALYKLVIISTISIY